jgi:DNA-binding PadR family transcriptional regulator
MTTTSRLEFALLGLLQQQAQSGYDLRKTFSNTPMRHFSDSPGSIYPALRRLEERGWISGKEENDSARKRQVYRITASGKRALIDWLSQHLTREDIVHRQEELMLRFAFLDGNVERDVTLRFMGQMVEILEAYVKELRNYFKRVGPAIVLDTGRMAFEGGIESYEASLNWARSARKKLEKQS